MTSEQKHFKVMLNNLFKNKSKEEKIDYLKHLSNLRVGKHDKETYSDLRSHKHPTKEKCYVCGNFGNYDHHIILLANGGYDNKKNRIHICHQCHKLIHPWMR
jgi:hypothetical protein